MAYVLAGGRGARLNELTDKRAKPAVYFGGKARIIDFALSNAVNSGIRRIAVATQYKAHSLIRHLQQGWDFFRTERNESFDILPASQRVSEGLWYQGTADAVYQNIDIIDSYGPEFMVVLAGDHIYKMDYELMLMQHVETKADVTVGCIEVPKVGASAFGIIAVDEKDVITDFIEKPANPPTMPGKPDSCLVSMGIYVFRTKKLFEELRRDAATPGSSRDFGKDIIPYLVKHGKAVAHRFSDSCVRASAEAEPYWRDVGTVDAYWEANIDLTDVVPKLDLYDTGEIRARSRRPPRQRRSLAGRRRLHHLRLASAPLPVLHRRAVEQLLRARGRGDPAALLDRPQRAAAPGGARPRCAHPRRARGRRGSQARRPALPPHGKGHLPHHPGHGRQTGMTTRVLSVVSEAYPLVKTGGLGDVAGALPAALAQHDVEVTTLLPGYGPVLKALQNGHVLHSYHDLLGTNAKLIAGTAGGLVVIVLDAPELYGRDGGPYCDSYGKDWPDNWLRFAALGRAAADLAEGKDVDPVFDLMHAHDWQGAMAPAYLRYDGSPVPSVITVHNIAFPGWFPPESFPSLKLPRQAYSIEGVEYYGGVGFLKAGLHTADAITTVSPTYAEEIRMPEFGMGLEGLISARQDRVFGIVNGIDTTIWNPATDKNLAVQYDARALHQRRQNRRAVEKAFSLDEGHGPLFCVISRLTTQKGMDVLAGILDDLVAMGGRLALLGSGDTKIETAFIAASNKHRGKIGVTIGYDEALSHLLQGGADAILIPSRFEPCGLTQLYGLRYGCVPVAARTGGLADTIIDANEAAIGAGVATGFLFDGVTPPNLTRALQHAITRFADRKAWKALQEQGMKADFSWKRSGRQYADLYRRFVKTPAHIATGAKTVELR
jgi:starch synthase